MPNSRRASTDRPLTLIDILLAVIEYKWRVAFTVLVLLAASVVAVLLFPKKYESEAKMFVRLGRGSVTMDTAATTGQTISIQESRETEMNSIVDMLESRELAEHIVKQLGSDALLKKYAWIEKKVDELTELIPSSGGSVMVEDGDQMTPEMVKEQQRFELAVKYVMKNIKISSPKKSTTVSVVCRARTPGLAQKIAGELIDAYRDMHLNAYKAEGSHRFFEENFAAHERMVKEYQVAMREAKNEMSVVTLSGKQDSLQSQITDVQKEIIMSDSELYATRASLLDLMADMDRLPPELATEKTSGIANGANDTMRDRLYELEIREKELASKYKSVHPSLVKLREQLSNSRTILASQKKDREHQVMGVNPVRQDVHKMLLDEKSKIAGLEARGESLRRIQHDLYQQLKKVNTFEVDALELKRQIDVADANYRIYAEKLEQSRINAALDSEAISNVSLVQNPTYVMKHVSPKRSLLGVLGLMFSLLCGLMVAIASDRFPGVNDDYAVLDERVSELETKHEEPAIDEQAEIEATIAAMSNASTESRLASENSDA